MWRGLKLAARILAKDRLFTIAVIALLAALGAVIGVALAWLSGPRIQAMLYEVEPFDARAIAAAVACMVLFAVTGALAPSLRAARTQPSQVLREQ